MPGKRDPNRFTRKETIERLQEVKSFLGNRERVAFRRADNQTKDNPIADALILIPDNYDPLRDDSYYCSSRLDDQRIDSLSNRLKAITASSWYSDTLFIAGAASDFVDIRLSGKAIIGSVVDIVFYPWKQSQDGSSLSYRKATKFAVAWLGTWHHSPKVAWCGARSTENIIIDNLPKYSDLIK